MRRLLPLIFVCALLLLPSKGIAQDDNFPRYVVAEYQRFLLSDTRISTLHCDTPGITEAILWIEGEDCYYTLDGTPPTPESAHRITTMRAIRITADEAMALRITTYNNNVTHVCVLWLIDIIFAGG